MKKIMKFILSIIFAPFKLFILILLWFTGLPPVRWFLKFTGIDNTFTYTTTITKEYPPLDKEVQDLLDKVNKDPKKYGYDE